MGNGLKLYKFFLILFFSLYCANVYGQAIAIGSGTWDPINNTGTASWAGGGGIAGAPIPGDNIIISNNVTVTLINHGAGDYGFLSNQSGLPSGFNLSQYSITFSGNVEGGCIGTSGSVLILNSPATVYFTGTYTADSIRILNAGSKVFNALLKIYGSVRIGPGSALKGNNATMQVYGALVNNGTLSWESNAATFYSYGDLVNNALWTISSTYAMDSARIGGKSPYAGNLIITGRRVVAGKPSIAILTIQDGGRLYVEAGDTLLTTGHVQMSGTGRIQGSGVWNMMGNNVVFSGTAEVSKIFMGPSGKRHFANATLKGDITLQTGVILQNNGSTVLELYGRFRNYGTVQRNVVDPLVHIYGDVENHGEWTLPLTVIKGRSVLSGSKAYSGWNLVVDTTCRIMQGVQIARLHVKAGDTLEIPGLTDTLVVFKDTLSVIDGVIYGSGFVRYRGSVQSSHTTARQIYFEPTVSSNISGYFQADSILFSGNGTVVYTQPVHLYGSVRIGETVSIQGNGTSMNINGNVLNLGSVISSGGDTVRITHDLLNYGNWQVSFTYLTDTGAICGHFNNPLAYLFIQADRYLKGNVMLSCNTNFSGIITTSLHDTVIVLTDSFNRLSGYIQGNLALPVPVGNPVLQFPMGDVNGYTPVEVQLNGVSVNGQMTLSLKTGIHPLIAQPDRVLRRHWRFGKNENLLFDSYSALLSYRPEDFHSAIQEPLHENEMIAGLKTPSRWIFPEILVRYPGGTNDGGSLLIGNLNVCSDIVIGADTLAFNLNSPPLVMTPLPDTTLSEDFGSLYIADLNAVFMDPEGQPMTFSTMILSGNIGLSLDGDSLFLHSIPDTFGEVIIAVYANDGNKSSSDTFVVNILPVNDPPSAFALLYPADQDTFQQQDTITFLWRKAADNDGDLIYYSLYLTYYLPDSQRIDTVLGPVTDTTLSYYPEENLTYFILPCYWTVKAEDNEFSVLAADTFTFYRMGGLDVADKNPLKPAVFALLQNYPNPFNPRTRISYQLAENSPVEIRIYNLLGQQVKTLVQTVQPAGYYSVYWDGTNNTGRTVSAGVYIYRMKAGAFIQSRKMILMK